MKTIIAVILIVGFVVVMGLCAIAPLFVDKDPDEETAEKLRGIEDKNIHKDYDYE